MIAYQNEGVLMLEGRRDMVAIFDIRVHPSSRRTGIARLLFAEAGRWAKSRGCISMKMVRRMLMLVPVDSTLLWDAN